MGHFKQFECISRACKCFSNGTCLEQSDVARGVEVLIIVGDLRSVQREWSEDYITRQADCQMYKKVELSKEPVKRHKTKK